MRLESLRRCIAEYGRKLLRSGLSSGTGGNLSIRDTDSGLIAISPSGMEYDTVEPADVVLIDDSGQRAEGHRRPSSEWEFHLAAYRARPDARALVHTHSPYATTFACLGEPIPPIHYLIGFSQAHQVPVAPYATFGTPELAASVEQTMPRAAVILLEHHGLLACGADMASAFARAEEIEFVARLAWQARALGGPVPLLSESQMQAALERFADYGQKTGKDHI